MVMGYLDRGFQDMMLVLKARMGDSRAPSFPDMNPCDCFEGGYLKELVNKLLPANVKDLRERITREFSNLPEAMVAKADSAKEGFKIKVFSCKMSFLFSF
jgi:hypothetical protein